MNGYSLNIAIKTSRGVFKHAALVEFKGCDEAEARFLAGIIIEALRSDTKAEFKFNLYATFVSSSFEEL